MGMERGGIGLQKHCFFGQHAKGSKHAKKDRSMQEGQRELKEQMFIFTPEASKVAEESLGHWHNL